MIGSAMGRGLASVGGGVLLAWSLTGCSSLPDAGPASCEHDAAPVVMLHGFLASGDTWGPHAARFEREGYCPEQLLSFDWNSLADGELSVARLDASVDALLEATGAEQVDIIGHSAGGRLALDYLGDPTRAAKVAHYAHVASDLVNDDGVAVSVPGGVPTLHLYSEADLVAPAGMLEGAENTELPTHGHVEVATSPESFAAIYEHFRGVPPSQQGTSEMDSPVLEGKALFFAVNDPAAGWTVEVFRVESESGDRTGTDAEARFSVDQEGRWGPFEAEIGERYELRLAPEDGDGRAVHHYFEPTTRSHRHLVLRALPPGSLVGALLDTLPVEGSGVTIVFSSERAVVHGRDTLMAGGRELSAFPYARADRSTIAYFLYDDGNDGVDGGETGLFGTALPIFVTAVDTVLSVDEHTAIELNGRRLVVPNWAAEDGISIVQLGVGDAASGGVDVGTVRCDPVANTCPDVAPVCEVVWGPPETGAVDYFTCREPRGDAALGEACERPTGQPGQDTCGPDLYCAFNGLPQSMPQARTCLAVCNANQPACAGMGEVCHAFDVDGLMGVCAPGCEPFEPGACVGSTKCGLYDDRVTDADVLWMCDFDGAGVRGDACDDSSACSTGHVCVSGSCQTICDGANPCAADETCQPLEGAGTLGVGICV